MHAIRKLLRIVFAVSGLLALAAFGLTIFGPWTNQALSLFRMNWYSYLVQALTAITAVGLLVNLVLGIVSRKNDTILVDRLEGGQLIISRDAIASQAAHIVEADGTCSAQNVNVTAKRKGHVRVAIQVLPHSSIDVVAKGQALHEQLTRDLSTLCGNNLESVSLEFLQPEMATDLAQATYAAPAYEPAYEAPAIEAPVAEPTVVAPATADNPTVIIEPSVPAPEAGWEEA